MSINLSKSKTPCRERTINERISDFKEIVLGYSKEEAILESQRCLNCVNPACVLGCPASNNIPLFIKHIKDNNLSEAYNVLRLTSNMPEICSRVCDQEKQCEKNCVRGKNGEPVAIGLLERYICDSISFKNAAEPQYFSKHIAIIGSGPAGLSCAEELLNFGYGVTIFDSEIINGGLLTFGIPNYRLPYKFVEEKINVLKKMGAIFKNKKLGSDLFIDELKKEYDAIFLAIGASKPKLMRIPGEDVNGLITSNEFLYKISKKTKLNENITFNIGSKVAVVGGGNSAIDAARSALRLENVTSVEIIYRRTLEDMPAGKQEILSAIDEGVKITTLVNPIEILSNDDKLTGIKLCKMYQTEVGSDGRRGVKPIENSEFINNYDTVIYAIGNETENVVKNLKEIELSKWNTILLTDKMNSPKDPLVFASGDVVTGPATVVQAMKDGKFTARKIHEFLKNI